MKIITFFENYLRETTFLCQESVFTATIFVWIEETKKGIIFLHIIRLKKNLWKEHFLMKVCKDNALIFPNTATIMIFLIHEN